jgi:hypothetical protein
LKERGRLRKSRRAGKKQKSVDSSEDRVWKREDLLATEGPWRSQWCCGFLAEFHSAVHMLMVAWFQTVPCPYQHCIGATFSPCLQPPYHMHTPDAHTPPAHFLPAHWAHTQWWLNVLFHCPHLVSPQPNAWRWEALVMGTGTSESPLDRWEVASLRCSLVLPMSEQNETGDKMMFISVLLQLWSLAGCGDTLL